MAKFLFTKKTSKVESHKIFTDLTNGVINLVWIDDNVESRGDGKKEMAELDDDGSPEWGEFHLSVSDHLQQ
jgi:hypothetical protein